MHIYTHAYTHTHTSALNSMDIEQQLHAYYQQLTPFEQRTCDIARDHLGSSFDLARSNGFIKYQLQIKPK